MSKIELTDGSPVPEDGSHKRDRQRAEIERLTRERDEARSASVPGSAAVFAAVEAERDRMRAALEKIADFDCRSDEHVGDMKCWSCYARDALSSEPSPDETTARRMTRAEADAMNRAFWRSVEIIDDIDDREEVAPVANGLEAGRATSLRARHLVVVGSHPNSTEMSPDG